MSTEKSEEIDSHETELIPKPPTNTLAMVSMLCGIGGWLLEIGILCFGSTIGSVIALATLGIAFLCLFPIFCIPILAWLSAVITGHIALGQLKESEEGGKGLAKTGLISGYIGLGIFLLSLCAIVFIVMAGVSIPFIDDIIGEFNF